jgi:DNA repair exonuclease SbcCD nuclease subunit
MKRLIIGDVHQGLNRKTGVTVQSLESFEGDKALALMRVMGDNRDKEVIIAGDLFDSSAVSLISIVRMVRTLTAHPRKVYVIAGNHDLSKDSTKLSSLLMFKEWVESMESNVEVVLAPLEIEEGTWLLPHQVNQEAFDRKLLLLQSEGAKVVVTHCNYENNFAVEADHSLNMTKEQATMFDIVVSGHEHNARTLGNVSMIGSFLPCTVDEASVDKHCLILEGTLIEKYEHCDQTECCWYEEVDWHDLEDYATEAGFIKIVGTATSEEAALALNAVAAFRKQSHAYMIRNAVVLEKVGLEVLEGEALDNIDALVLLGKLLSDEHKKMLKGYGYEIN